MRVGNVSQTIMRKDILKVLRTGQEEILFPPIAEERCAAFDVGKDTAVTATACVSGEAVGFGVYGMLQAVQDVAAKGAEPTGVTLHLLLPVHMQENRIKHIITHMEAAGRRLKVPVAAVRAEVCPAVNQPVLYVTAIGEAARREVCFNGKSRAGEDIVLLGWTGLEGTLRILAEQEEALGKRFVPAFLHQTKALEEELYILDHIKRLRKYPVTAIQQIGSGGIFAALWELTESAGIGMEIEMKQISIRQETVEICEFVHRDPYRMTSCGSALITVKDSEPVIDELQRAGARATKLGVTTNTPVRVILGQTEKRYLDRPQPDEWMVWLEQTRCVNKESGGIIK